jgi:hypothetical protein
MVCTASKAVKACLGSINWGKFVVKSSLSRSFDSFYALFALTRVSKIGQGYSRSVHDHASWGGAKLMERLLLKVVSLYQHVTSQHL